LGGRRGDHGGWTVELWLCKAPILDMEEFPCIYAGVQSQYIPQAYERVARIYNRGKDLLTQEEPDVTHLRIVLDEIDQRIVPLLGDLGQMNEVPTDWLGQIYECLEHLRRLLQDSIDQLGGCEFGG